MIAVPYSLRGDCASKNPTGLDYRIAFPEMPVIGALGVIDVLRLRQGAGDSLSLSLSRPPSVAAAKG